jgi:hypothetical protein
MATEVKIKRQIIEEIATSIAILGGNSDVLGIVSSIGDSQTDEDVLTMLKHWNKTELKNKKKVYTDTVKYCNR